MEVVRKKLTRKGKQLIIDLPDSFKSEKVEVIVLPASDDEEKKEMTTEELAAWREDLSEFYSKYNADFSNFKFNRDELYDRP